MYSKKAGVDPEWTDFSGLTALQAGGNRDVLIIVSENVSGPDVVRRRAAIELTEEWRGKLESQGIAWEHQYDDLSLVKARYSLDKTYTTTNMPERGGLTKERVLKQVNTLMKNCNDGGGNSVTPLKQPLDYLISPCSCLPLHWCW